MRTTVNITDSTLMKARDMARRQQRSLSDVLSEAAATGLRHLSGPMEITPDPATGFPGLDLGFPTSRADTAAARDSE